MTEPKPRVLKHSARVGQFEIRDVLGSGAYGITYEAYDRALERPAAIKEYFPTALALRQDDRFTVSKRSPELAKVFGWGLKAFIREARTLAAFNEPTLVRVQQYVETNGTGYLAMNYEDGCTLSQVLAQWQRLNQQQARALAVHMLRGLSALHASGYLHRDVSPASIMVRRSGPPVLIDFGTARRTLAHALSERNLESDDGKAAALQAFVPLELASIDVAEEAEQGPWSDLYALGATVYASAVGEPPASAPRRIAAIRDGAADPLVAGLDRLASTYNRELCEAIEWMMQLEPGHRPRQASDVLGLLTPSRKPGAVAIQTSAQAGSQAGSISAQTTAHASPANGADHGAAPFDTFGQSPGGHAESSPAHSGVETSGANATTLSSAPGSAESAPLVLDAVLMGTVRAHLTRLLGPIAPTLIKRTMARCASELELFESLADELDVPDERDAFLDACSAASNASRDSQEQAKCR